MKTPIKTLLFILTVVLLCQCEKDLEPESDPEVTIPDNNFLNALIELGIDTNGDGIISITEAEEITFLPLSFFGSINMAGIEAFVNLDTLFCVGNGLTGLNISNNIALTWLECSSNQLTNLDISNNADLEILGCGNNQLTTLDVSNNIDLKWLDFDFNQLTSLNVSNNTFLQTLNCSSNQLTSLDQRDPTTGIPYLKHQRCRLEKT